MSWLSDWKYRIKLTVDSSVIDSDLTHFAIPITLGPVVGKNSYDASVIFDELGANSKKIAVTKDDGTTQIYVEVEGWDSINERGVLWVSKSDLTILAASDTILYIYFDNTQADNNSYVGDVGSRTEVWKSVFKSLLHLKESGNGTANEYVDSTGNAHHGTGGAGSAAQTPDLVDSILYKGQDFEHNNSDVISIADHADLDLANNDFVLTQWVKIESYADTYPVIRSQWGSAGNYSWLWHLQNNNTINFNYSTNGSNSTVFSVAWVPTFGVWYKLTIRRSGSLFRFYVNDIQQGADKNIGTDTIFNGTARIWIGSYDQVGQTNGWFDGIIDEVRYIVGNGESDAWVKASFYAEDDNLLTWGPEESFIFEDINTDIRVKFQTYFKDIDTDIRISKQLIEDINTDIRVKLEEHFKDIDTDIRAVARIFEDINTDIRVVEDVIQDIITDIRVAQSVIKDIDTDLRVVIREFKDIATDFRVAHRISKNQVVIEELYFEEGRFLSSQNVTIRMKVYGALKMQFKNEVGGIWSALENYSDSKDWTLDAGDGTKQVYVRFVDIQNVLSDGTDVIEAVLNTTTPTAVTIEAYTDETCVTPILDSTYQTDKTPFFRWQVPVFNIPYNGFSYALDGIPLDIGTIATPDMVRNGMVVSKKAPTTNMIFEITTGYYYFKSDLKECQVQEITLSNGDLVNDRIDVIYVSGTSESLNVAEGTPDPSPEEPEIPEDAIKLATVLVPVGITKSEDTTLTEARKLYVELDKYLEEPLTLGQHTIKVKGICANGSISNIATFNIWVANNSPTIGEVKCYTDGTKLVELANGLYQTTDNTPYFEWDVALAEPGPIRYYYTEDGTDPDIGDFFVTVNNYTPAAYLEGITLLKVRAYDVTTGYWGPVKSFIFIYGTQTFTNDTAVICGNTILKQSLKEIHLKEISWDFNSARICRIFQPVAFDATLSFAEGDILSVVYGSTNATLFTGRILQIERTIDIGEEGVTYHCSCSRQDLAEEYAYITHEDYGDTAQITFDDIPLNIAIDTIVSKFPTIVKNIESYPSGANISDEYIGQTVSNILDSIYAKTKYGWYMKPNGSLVSIDLTAINSGEAKFGIYGTTVHPLTPQYNVMASNLQFDITNRYNKCIIEGAKKLERVTLKGKCIGFSKSGEEIVDEGDRADDIIYKVFELDTKWTVTKIIETYISYARLKKFVLIPLGFSEFLTKFIIVFLETEICNDNSINRMVRKTNSIVIPGDIVSTTSSPTEAELSEAAKAIYLTSNTITYGPPSIEHDTEIQGSLGPNNTVRFSRSMYNFWPIGASINSDQLEVTPDININQQFGVLNYIWRNPPTKKCATLTSDVLIETIPLKVEVNVSGSASGVSKTLRIVNTSFRYSEDPEDLVDDTARMAEYAEDLLEKYKDIKVNGSITLDTIDLSWDLDKTVNLINTAQGSWTTLNAKVIGIKYDFDMNTTTLEITSEYLK
jgi:hypothetical protein